MIARLLAMFERLTNSGHALADTLDATNERLTAAIEPKEAEEAAPKQLKPKGGRS